MDESGRACLVVGCLLVLTAVVPAGIVAQKQSTPDNTVTNISVAANGDARWTVTVRTRLENDSEVRDYRAFQERFRNDTARYLDPFRTRIHGVVATGENATGRQMRAVNFSASTSIQQVPRRWGVVTYTFDWHGFAQAADEDVVAGDVFQGGFYLARGDILTLSGPDGYRLASTSPGPDTRDNGTITWAGPKEFADEQPRVRYEQGTESAADTSTRDQRRNEGFPFVLAVITAVIVLAAGGGLFVYRRTTRETAQPIQTDADHVRALLQERGGQAKQTVIADELGWSPSKTSRVVSGLEEEDIIEKTRVGRENVIRFEEEH